LIKFGTVVHISTSDDSLKNLECRTATKFKILKSRYLKKQLSDCDEILHNDTHWLSRAYQLFKNSNLKNRR